MNYNTRQKKQYSTEINKIVLVAAKFEFKKAKARVSRKVAVLYYTVPVPVGTSGSLSITRETLHMWYVNYVWAFFPCSQSTQWTYSQHTSTILPRVHFAKHNQRRELGYQVVSSLFRIPKFQKKKSLFHIMLSPIQLKCAPSFFIWCPNFPCYLFSVCVPDIKQTARRNVWEEICQHLTSYILLCVRSLLQELHPTSVYVDSFYVNSIHQYTVCSVTCNKLEV
jgi:hypothetical protein